MFLSEYCPQEINSREIHLCQSLKKCKVIFMVHIDSWIIEKVLKFAEQFSSPGKSLEKRNKVM